MPDEPAQPPRPKRRRLRRVLKVAAILLVAFVALVAVFLCTLEWWCCATPPELEGHPAILDARPEEADGVRRIGASWLARRQGLLRMHLEGDPFTLGYAHAALTEKFAREQEEHMLEFIEEFVPSSLNRWLLKKLVLLRNYDLTSYIHPAYQLELYGLTRGAPDPHPELGPLYTRVLNYHAAHDISHAVMDSPLIQAPSTDAGHPDPAALCTSFAAWGAATQGGHLLIGRNFDFNALPDFDHNRVVARVVPDDGLPFISVTWPGLIGVVSGINDERISISVNAAQCGDMRRIGTPVSLVMRHVLQHADSLDAAIGIIRDSQVFVADCYLVADGETGEAAVVEKTPLRCAVRRPAAGEASLVCSNHFLTPELEADAANVRYLAEGTTVARHERMEALLAARQEPLSPATAAAILRDRAVPGVPRPVLGHLAAINSITATHSVVIDATAGIIWVAVTPHQLGPYVPFGLKTFEDPPGAATIPADPILADGSYGRCIQARQLVKDARKLGRAGRHDEAAAELSKAIALNPDHYLAHLILGRMRLGQKRFAEAAAHLERAQALHPAFGSQRRAVAQMLATCRRQGAD